MQVQNLNTAPTFLKYNKETELDHLVIEPQPLTPFVKFSREKGLLMIKGKSMEENVTELYDPLITVVDNYLCHHNKLTCYFYFKEFNLPTTKCLFHLFKNLGEHHLLGRNITINWFADWHNSEMIQTGIDYAEMYGLKIHIMPI